MKKKIEMKKTEAKDAEMKKTEVKSGEAKKSEAKAKNFKRIIIVYNPRSSRAGDVEVEVMDVARRLKGYVVGRFMVEQIGVMENAKNLAKVLVDGDLVVSAGGDGTASIALNGVVKSKKMVSLAVLPYGNFNDVAMTFGVKTLRQALMQKSVEVWPLEVRVNDKLWRYALSYVTVGMMAEATEIFEEKKLRKRMQRGRLGVVRSGWMLFVWWLGNRGRKFMPKGKLNEHILRAGVTDYFAMNGRVAGGVLRDQGKMKDEKVFLSGALELARFLKLFGFLLRGNWGKMGEDLDLTEGDVLEFEKPSRVEVQAEGEFERMEGVSRIEIRKGRRGVRMVRG